MSTDRARNDFINFIVDATQEPELVIRFNRRRSPMGVYRFFQENGYKDIPLNDCEDILFAARSVRGKGLSATGGPADTIDPDDPNRGY